MMRKRYTTPLYAAALILMAACDTTEERVYPGPESDIDLKVVETGAIRLAADGKGKTINVESTVYWDATLSQTGNNFSVSQSTERCNGTVTVDGTLNYNDTRRDAKLYITARNINKQIEIDVVQAQLLFSMDRHDDVAVPEQGGSFSFEFSSTIEWTFRVSDNTGETPDWVKFTPGQSGYGDWEPISMTIDVMPNYTLEERSLTIALRPVDDDALEIIGSGGDLPQSFTITQAPGTPVSDLTAVAATPDYTACDFTLSYKSNSPVVDAGVKIADLSGTAIGNFVADKIDNAYPASGSVAVHVTGLAQGTGYRAIPYVTSMVGTVEGDAVEFVTKADVVYEGVKISESNCEIKPESRSVAVYAAFESDVDVTEGGIVIYDSEGKELKTYSTALAADARELEITSEEILEPKTEYRLKVFVRSVQNTADTPQLTFTTKGLSLDEGDNNPPE